MPDILALAPGVTVSLSVYRLVLDLEARGLAFVLASDGMLHVGPKHLLTETDYQAIAESKPDVRAIVAHGQRRPM